MKRLNDLRQTDKKLAQKIVMRQKKGTMRKLMDCFGYVCYDEKELANWTPRKAGRPPKTFVCEICGQITPIEYEGAEPNCCEDCKPLTKEMLHKRAEELKNEK